MTQQSRLPDLEKEREGVLRNSFKFRHAKLNINQILTQSAFTVSSVNIATVLNSKHMLIVREYKEAAVRKSTA